MFFVMELIGLFSLVAVVVANGFTPYRPPYSDNHHPPKNHKDVELHKLCSWNVIEFESDNYLDDSWHPLKLDAGRSYIPENNIPTGFKISHDGRGFVSLARKYTGVFATLAFFFLKDIKDGRCPPLRPFPSEEENSLNTDCDSKRRLINVERFNIDHCNRLWAVDRRGLNLNDKNWVLGSPRLMIYNLNNNKIDREVPIPSEYYYKYQLGLETVIINTDPKDCGNAYGYIVDTWNGCIIVYSYKQNKFWKVSSPEFYSDGKYSKFTIKTRKHEEVTYYRDSMVFDCALDNKRSEAVCHSVASLNEFTIPISQLNSEEVARCSPDSLNVKFLGQKSKYSQTGSHSLNPHNQVVWGVQELNYGVGCWNRENELKPSNVHVVVSDLEKLPFVADLSLTKHDLSPYCKSHRQSYNETYVVILSNNLIGIQEHGFNHKEENFGIYVFKESEALNAFPQCLPQEYKSHSAYNPEYKQEPVYKSELSYRPETSYKAEPSYKPIPSFKPEPSYKPEHSYEPEVSYEPESSYKHEPSYKPGPSSISRPETTYEPESPYKNEPVNSHSSKHQAYEPEPYVQPTKSAQHQHYVPVYQHSARPTNPSQSKPRY